MLSDKCHKPVKKFVHKTVLTEKQQYPQDVLLTTRLIANFHQRRHKQDKEATVVAAKSRDTVGHWRHIIEKDKDKGPSYHICSKIHRGTWKACNIISKEHYKLIAKLANAGVFTVEGKRGRRNTAGGGKTSKQKKRTNNTTVADTNTDNEEETKADGLPTCDVLL
jgi:hypothetical protein